MVDDDDEDKEAQVTLSAAAQNAVDAIPEKLNIKARINRDAKAAAGGGGEIDNPNASGV